MFPYVIFAHHLGYSLQKESIKRKVDLQNYETAKTELESTIAEQESSYSYTFINKKKQYGDNIILKHALNHLNEVIDKEDPSFIDTSNNGEIKHHSDIVKEALQREPKSDYT